MIYDHGKVTEWQDKDAKLLEELLKQVEDLQAYSILQSIMMGESFLQKMGQASNYVKRALDKCDEIKEHRERGER